ncbi:hypothetical protein EVAR_96756_1 [Eumeta japonica]|uniref:Uncharacterized protein n=1 Tax=Eumeta variegata TaxID=151549 RepID=A0A4C1Y343_EUMVA|nr:hypothetical protein EVAR_96756_1 [Eumeta japonica]
MASGTETEIENETGGSKTIVGSEFKNEIGIEIESRIDNGTRIRIESEKGTKNKTGLESKLMVRRRSENRVYPGSKSAAVSSDIVCPSGGIASVYYTGTTIIGKSKRTSVRGRSESSMKEICDRFLQAVVVMVAFRYHFTAAF